MTWKEQILYDNALACCKGAQVAFIQSEIIEKLIADIPENSTGWFKKEDGTYEDQMKDIRQQLRDKWS